jgi:MFS family permease
MTGQRLPSARAGQRLRMMRQPRVAEADAVAPPAAADGMPQWRVWLAAIASYTAIGTAFQVLPPYTAAVGHAMGVSATVAGLGMPAFLLPVPLLAVPAGALCDRYGTRLLTRAGFAVLLASAALLAAVPGFGWLLGARAAGGVGTCLLMVGTLKMLGARVPAPRLGSALGVFVAGLPVGTVLAFDVIAPLAGGRAWRAAALGAAAAVAAAFPIVTWAAADAPASRPAPVRPARPRQPRRARRRGGRGVLASADLWWLVALTGTGYATIIAFTTWAPAHVAHYAGLTRQTSLVIASVLLAVDIPAAPAWGRLSDRLGRRKPFLVLAFAVYAAGAAGLPLVARMPGPRALWLALTVAIMGTGCAMFLPATLAVVPALVPAAGLGTGYGLVVAAQMTGMAAGPLAIGPVFAGPGTVAGLEAVAALAVIGVILGTRIRAR